MKITKRVYALCFCCFLGLYAHSQDTLEVLKLDIAIQTAQQNNKTIASAEIDEKIAQNTYKQSFAMYLPLVSLAYTAMATNNPLNSFGFKLQQAVVTPNDFNPTLLNSPSNINNYNAKVEFQQPLVNLDRLYIRKAAKQNIEINGFKTKRAKEYIGFEVKKAYFQLQYVYRVLHVMDTVKTTVNEIYRNTTNFYAQGMIQKSDVLNVQIRVAMVESNRQKTLSCVKNLSDYLSVLMGKSVGKVYEISDTVFINTKIENTALNNNRADLMVMQKAIQASEMMVQSGQMSLLPRVNAFGNYQVNDASFLGTNAKSYFVGLQMSWDVFKGNTNKYANQNQVLERKKLEKQLQSQQMQGTAELEKTYRDLADLELEELQKKLAVEQAQEAYRILFNRFQKGLTSTADLLMAESQLAQQKLAFFETALNKNVLSAYYSFIQP
jgi:outer membrane protein TolC